MQSIEEWVEESVEKYEKEVCSGNMPAHNKVTLRNILLKEAQFWQRWDARKDNHTGADDQ